MYSALMAKYKYVTKLQIINFMLRYENNNKQQSYCKTSTLPLILLLVVLLLSLLNWLCFCFVSNCASRLVFHCTQRFNVMHHLNANSCRVTKYIVKAKKKCILNIELGWRRNCVWCQVQLCDRCVVEKHWYIMI